MKVVCSDGQFLFNMLKAAEVMIAEPTITLSREGLSIRSMDASHVAMIEASLPKNVFDEYEVGEEGERICVNLEELLKRVKAGKDDQVNLQIEENKLVILIRDGGSEKRFRIPLLEASVEEIPKPKTDLTANVKIVSATLAGLVEEAASFGGAVTLTATPETFIIVTDGDYGSVETTFSKDSENMLGLEVKEETVKAVYSLSYLQLMVRAGKRVSEVAVLEWASEKPLKLTFELPQTGTLAYWLAPRISE